MPFLKREHSSLLTYIIRKKVSSTYKLSFLSIFGFWDSFPQDFGWSGCSLHDTSKERLKILLQFRPQLLLFMSMTELSKQECSNVEKVADQGVVSTKSHRYEFLLRLVQLQLQIFIFLNQELTFGVPPMIAHETTTRSSRAQVFFEKGVLENFVKKETLSQMSYYQFWEIFEKTFFTEQLWQLLLHNIMACNNQTSCKISISCVSGCVSNFFL